MNRQGYFMEQLCTIGIAVGYCTMTAALFVSLWSAPDSQRTVLGMIAPWIRFILLIAGCILCAQAVVRAVFLWKASGSAPATSACHTGHGHGTECSLDHDHSHEHRWSPWRFTFLVFPLILFLLPFDWHEMIVAVETKKVNKSYLGIDAPGSRFEESWTADTALIPPGFSGAGATALVSFTARSVDYIEETTIVPPEWRPNQLELQSIARSPSGREHWRNRPIELQGFLYPQPGLPLQCQVTRWQRGCCDNDAIPVSACAVVRDPANEAKRIQKANEIQSLKSKWVTVVGRLHFTQVGGRYVAVLKVISFRETRPPHKTDL